MEEITKEELKKLIEYLIQTKKTDVEIFEIISNPFLKEVYNNKLKKAELVNNDENVITTNRKRN